ncbi:MAG: DUF1559 domain-containing protein [Planctomycetes bacterium]|nr:DUF1559 domain-containing protein [Planctomycetota bacterium]
MRSKHHRFGYTLIEVLIVVAIISVIVSILLPAVQRSREAARRVQCRNNLKQLGIALHSYHDTHSTFPMGYHWPLGTGWTYHILPFIEQGPLFSSFAVNTPSTWTSSIWRDGAPEAALKVPIPLFRCPSSTSPTALNNVNGISVRIPCDYLACASGNRTTDSSTSVNGVGAEGLDGLFFRISRVRITHINDGTSNTIALGETFYESPEVDHWAIGSDDLGRRGIPDTSDASEFLGSLGVDLNLFDDQSSRDAIEISFKSKHPGGVHLLLADGTVRFVSENISSYVRKALGTRNGKETVGEF